MPLDTSAFTKSVFFGAIGVLGLVILAQIPCIGWIFSLLSLLAYLAIGASYGSFTKQNGFKAEVVPTMVYGAIAAAVASIVPIVLTSLFGADSALGFLIGTPFAICFGAMGTGFLGGIGGAVYGALAE